MVLGVGSRVRVRPGTDAESLGVIVEDFGEMSLYGTQDTANQIGMVPRRWGIALDDGTLTFVDSDQLANS
ncbi:hypothetical protein BST14_18560 [Mycobacterium arosiense ATCC BAA-1401 = DSM 45069]|uniref:Uncharacterized protein n=1 Tax=Mycobacterium arosiense ATCC BAA-1401 = DSM 45069 TaxID=1265311 RepID=A0A1W9ZC68_MYCAI|nr:hypothetical protein BST14_18560 [Mycobacterium arosiense ATCC BAA-1401 = DSM 45069]